MPGGEKMQEARRKHRRLVEEADRAHMRTFSITPAEVGAQPVGGIPQEADASLLRET
jgi:hypothetical protein